MPINPDAVGSKGDAHEHSWSSKDAILYALGVGAGLDELTFTTENTIDTPQRVLPTMAVVLATGGFGAMANIGTFNPAMLVHGEQSIELFGEIPVEGSVSTVGEITGIYDKGKGAVVVTEWSGARSGGTFCGPLGPRSPPKPPSPRMKADMRTLNRGWPVATSVDTDSDTTTAPLPLS